MEVQNPENQLKSIEDIEAEFKWQTTEKTQLGDIMSEFDRPNQAIINAQQTATLIAVDLSEVDLPDDVEAIDENFRQLIDLQAKLNSQSSAIRSLQQRLTNNETIRDIIPPYKVLIEKSTAAYDAKTENDKYFKNERYNSFRQNIWSVNHPDESMPALATADDDDIVMESARISLKCPITTTWFEKPVTSKICKHTFSKDAIMGLLRRKGNIPCPIPGCMKRIALSELQDDEVMADRVRRAKARAEEQNKDRQSTQQFYDVE